MTGLFGKFIDGGLVFTVPIFLLLLTIIGLIIWGFLKKRNHEKAVSLLNHIGWFAVAWGFLGRTFGLIMAFDMVEAAGELTPRLLAEGMKMALVDPLFGIFVFIIARAGIILLIAIKKKTTKLH
ncbi:MAG TPA: MotA/TolQ/ExbB proton channel family protein [Prolixibacteraceae bacterium]|nr:MotA/TolQ/ExbB proton channel family protein [Prolixibacteraceae bacterium]